MGACCTRSLISHHTAKVDEILEVLWSDYHGAAIFGDAGQIARIPHEGCRLEILATATTAHPGVSLLLPGQVLRYKRSLFILDRLELPSGTKVGLWHFIGFKLRLLPNMTPPTRIEDSSSSRLAARPCSHHHPRSESVALRRGSQASKGGLQCSAQSVSVESLLVFSTASRS